eukprot:365465-Chlamydomonas_euryale.AAC.2
MALPWGQGIRSAPAAQPGYNCNKRYRCGVVAPHPQNNTTAPQSTMSQSQSQVHRERVYKGYACAEYSKTEGIKQRARRCQ